MERMDKVTRLDRPPGLGGEDEPVVLVLKAADVVADLAEKI